MSRQTTSIKVDPDIWKRFKSKASLKGDKLSEVVEGLIEEYYLKGDYDGKN